MPPDRPRNLEDELRDLGPRVEYPPTPELAGTVRGRIEAERSEGAGRDPRRVPAWAGWVVAAALLLLVAVPVFSLAVRGGMGGGAAGGASGVASGGGAQGGGGGAVSSGERATGGGPEAGDGPTTSSAQGAQAGSAAAGSASVSSGEAASASSLESGARRPPAGKGLGLGEKIPAGEARARSEAQILLPRSPKFGEPDETYDRRGSPGYTLLYRGAYPGLPDLDGTRVGLLLTQMPGDVGAAYLPGGDAEQTRLEAVSINGEEGYWVPATGDGPVVARSAGLLADVLLWERDGQALRLEADVSKEEAIRIAESVR